MSRTVLSVALGLTIGALLGGAMGCVLGAVCGVAIGFLWATTEDASARPPEGTPLAHEQRRLMCIPRGRPAECVLARDQHTRRWVDVESCSLCRTPTRVDCQKRCLVLMNDNRSHWQ
ncbi:MAG: hypothetical protein ACYTGW_14795 [Planctomycetota bacterium]|jgi:hypothetical protein